MRLNFLQSAFHLIDMEKFPLRMKDNDLLVTELFRDPCGDAITALSVYLTPRTCKLFSLCGTLAMSEMNILKHSNVLNAPDIG